MKKFLIISFLVFATFPFDATGQTKVYKYQKGDLARSKVVARRCMDCHGADGRGIGENFPHLAGQQERYMAKQLREMRASAHSREGVITADEIERQKRFGEHENLVRMGRSNEMMDDVVRNLSNQQIADVSAYYSSLKCRSATAKKPNPPTIAVR